MTFWAFMENITIEVGTVVVTFWATLRKLLLLFSVSSGHNAINVCKKLFLTWTLNNQTHAIISVTRLGYF